MTIDVVIIGLNSAKTLAACLDSVKASRFPQEQLTIYYADGGSSDQSKSIAEAYGATVVTVVADSPTPGRQRNAGWLSGTSELVQFLDSDTVMDPDWLTTASSKLVSGVVAVCGDRREFFPEKSVYNWIGDQEWNGKPGDVEAFGGDVLVTRDALVKSGGYNPNLIAGEDPELSYRVRKLGGRIERLAVPMTRHDLAMYTLRQYWKRGFRTGHAYAEVNSMHPEFWAVQTRRIVFKGSALALSVLALGLSVVLPPLLVIALAGILLFLRPRLQLVGQFERELQCRREQARTYAWHATLVVVPQFLGVLRYSMGKFMGKPLTNNRVLRRKRAQNAA